jgi:hypothetical protein
VLLASITENFLAVAVLALVEPLRFSCSGFDLILAVKELA